MIQSFLYVLLMTSSQAYPTSLKLSQGQKHINIKIREYKSFHLSENCFSKKTPKCEAYNATKAKVPPIGSKTGLLGHPAARYCSDQNASARILIAEDMKQYDFCLFKDGTMIDAWELYYKHFPKEVVE